MDNATTTLTTVAEPLYQTAATVTVYDNVLIHATGIKTAWSKPVAGFIEAGQLLLHAKKQLSGSGKFLKLFDKDVGDLPFGIDTAERLMKIAKNKVLTDSANWRNLPPSIRTLAELSKATPKQLEKWLTERVVTADTELKQVESLVKARAKVKTVKKDTDDSVDYTDATDEIDGDPVIATFTTCNATASNGSGNVQQAVQALYTLVCDAQADWSNVNFDMVRELVKELNGSLDDHAETESRDKEWQEPEAAKPPTEH
jgi:hypothetical protein